MISSSTNTNDLTFGHEDTLPPLPLPTIEGTCEKLLKSLLPLSVSESEYNEVAKKVFAFKNGIGKKLQNVLSVEASTTKNWLERHWDGAAYLNARYPCAVNTNWGVGLMGCGNVDLKKGKDMYISAACCGAAMAKFYVLTCIKSMLPPEKSSRGKPYSMFQNKRTFGVNQIPGRTKDRHSFSKDMKHIMIMSNNVWYKVLALSDTNQVINGVELAKILHAIHVDSKKYNVLPFQTLTSQNRSIWGEEDAISKAILCSPNCSHTWFDHSYNIIAFPNGSTGLQGNHSPADAMTALYMIRWLQESIRNNLIETVDTIDNKLTDGYDSGYIESDVNLATLNVTRYLFDSKPWGNANSAICNASIHAKDLFESINVRVVTFDTFGSDGAKVINISPDALVQMGLLLAYYRLHKGELPATYETAHTRQYFHGRTETIRSCSIEAKKMCEAMANSTIDSIEKEKAIRMAISAHNKYTFDCMNGQGIDRHLLVLQLIANEIGLIACSSKSIIKRSIVSPIFPRGYATIKNSCSAESETFQSEQEHLQFLESISTLPKGFQVGTSSFDFNPVELPTMDANMNMTVISLEKPSKHWAALFTKNAYPGAPIIYGRKLLQSGNALKGIVINNKISNVSSSSDGVQDAKDVANACLHFLQNNNAITVEDKNSCVLPSSTGVIGWRLPTEKMIENLKLACSLKNIQNKSILPAAKAIMTTDMFAKVRSVNIELNNENYRLVGIAKGAGMVEPNMATMLVYLLTDAPIDQSTLQKNLKHVVDKTFNCISIDSDMSTSDTIVAISSNTSKAIKLDDHAKATFEDAMFKVCDRLCEDVVRNGEGVKHVIRVHVKESISYKLANGIGKAIVNSPLFKAAINGNDPNVGRLLSAIGDYLGNNGYTTLDNMKIEIGDTLIYENGKFLINESVELRLKKVLEDSQMFDSEPHVILDETNGNVEQVLYPVPIKYPKHQKCVDITVSLGMENGEEEAVVRGADLTHEYVTENGAYRS
eukprot:g2955.t1